MDEDSVVTASGDAPSLAAEPRREEMWIVAALSYDGGEAWVVGKSDAAKRLDLIDGYAVSDFADWGPHDLAPGLYKLWLRPWGGGDPFDCGIDVDRTECLALFPELDEPRGQSSAEDASSEGVNPESPERSG